MGDQQAMEVLVFNTAADLLDRWGGPGEGPGELQRLDNLAVIHGDSLVARNDGGLRHEIYGPDGRYGRTVVGPAPTAAGGFGRVVGWFGDGSFIVAPTVLRRAPLASGRQVAEGEWHLFDAAGAHVALLAVLPERLVEVQGTPPHPLPVAYAPRVQSATDATGLWHAFPNVYEFRHIALHGVDVIIRRAWSPIRVPESLKDNYRAWYETAPLYGEVNETFLPEYVALRRAGFEVSRLGRAEPTPPIADTLPSFLRLIVAHDGYLWVEEHAGAEELLAAGPTAIGTGRWTIFDPQGRWLGTVSMPSGLRVTEIGPDYVLGVWLDELDVPFVRLHRIIKPGVAPENG